MKLVRPFADDSLSAACLQRLDAICRRFEAAWQQGETPSLEEYLTEAEAGERVPLLRALLSLELYYCGPRAEPAEYEVRFPGNAALLQEVFATTNRANPTPDVDPAVCEAAAAELAPTASIRMADMPGVAAARPAETPCATVTFTDSTRAEAPVQLPIVPGYEIQGVLGRGGMGIVYKAYHLALKRTVALKMVLAGGHAGSAERVRFLAEAEAVAALQHPNIVQVFDVGQHDGLPYMALEFVEGGSLHASLRDHLPSSREAAWLVEQLARGIAATHAKGIVHRDLKPANVLLQGAPELAGERPASAASREVSNSVPKITDFGLARKVEGGAGLTQSGAVMGTPSFMAPEQAQGDKDIGPAADIYALGAILYECLTGRPPFRGATPLDTILQVLAEEAPAVRQLQPRCPRDLETICHKCLQKDPARRYCSALELAEDLRRILADEPIMARPITRVERGWRWCRRYPARVAAATLSLVVLVVVPTLFGVYEAHNSRQLSAALKESRRQSASSTLERALALCEAGEVARGLLLLTRGLRTAEESEAADLQDAFRWNLDVWSREVHPLQRILTQRSEVCTAAFSPDGAIIATGAKDGKVRLWRTATGEPIGPELDHPATVHAVAFDPSGATLLTGCDDGSARRWDVTSGKRLDPILVHYVPDERPNPRWPYRTGVVSVAFSPDGRTIATGGFDGNARLWDAASAKPRGAPLRQVWEVKNVAFSSDGNSVWTSGGKANASQWSVSDGTVRTKFAESVYALAMAASPDATQVVVGYLQSNAAYRINASTGARLDPPLQHLDSLDAVAYHPDGKKILTGSTDQTARLWDAVTGQPLSPPLPHRAAVTAVAFHPHGRTFLTGDKSGLVRLWRLATTSQVSHLPHTSWVRGVAFTPDGRTLAATTSSAARAVVFWDVATKLRSRDPLPVPPPTHGQPDNWMEGLSIGPDGKSVWACCRQEARLVRYDIATGKILASIATEQNEPFRLAASRDGQRLLTGSFVNGMAHLWDTATAKPAGPPLQHEAPVAGVAFSPDGKIALTGSDDETTRLWDAATAAALGPPKQHGTGILAVAFSPDGRTIVTGGRNRAAQLWDAATWEPRGVPMQHEGAVESVQFSPDGQIILTGSKDGAARFWHTDSCKPVGPALRHRAVIAALAWSPNGSIVATGSDDMSIKLWTAPTRASEGLDQLVRWIEAITGMEIDANGTFRVLEPAAWHERRGELTTDRAPAESGNADATATSRLTALKELKVIPASPVTAVAYSLDGRRALSGGADHVARLWNVETGAEMQRFVGHSHCIWSVALSPDGKTAFTGSQDQTARLWDVDTGKPLHQIQGKETFSCVRFTPDGKRAAAACWDHTVRIWDVASGKQVVEFKYDMPILDIAFLPAGDRFLLGNITGTPLLCEAATGTVIRTFAGHFDSVHGVSVSRDGKRALSAGHDGTVRLWDVERGNQLHLFRGHRDLVHEVAFLPDGRHFISISEDKTVRLWDADGQERPWVGNAHTAAVRALAVHPDGRLALTASFDGSLRLWQLPELQAK